MTLPVLRITETLTDRDLIPPGLDNARRAQIINGLIQEFPFGLLILLLYLQCPAECERVFSSTKNLLTPERNALAGDIIEEPLNLFFPADCPPP
jgi:hypothetical protein